MFESAFEKLELAEVATIIDQVNPKMEGTRFDPIETTIMAQDLPFYPGYRLLDIADYTSMPAAQRFVIYGPKKFAVLNFTNEPIYAMNKEIPIRLNDDNVVHYIKFFFSFVRGKHGRFIISENVDDIGWKDDPPPQARRAVGRMLKPVSLATPSNGGDYNLEACMMFKDSLFKSKVKVKPDGLVNLSDEELLIEDMPVLDDTFGQ